MYMSKLKGLEAKFLASIKKNVDKQFNSFYPGIQKFRKKTEDAKMSKNPLSYEPVNLYNLKSSDSGKLRDANTRATSEVQSQSEGIFQINNDPEIKEYDNKFNENPGQKHDPSYGKRQNLSQEDFINNTYDKDRFDK